MVRAAGFMLGVALWQTVAGGESSADRFAPRQGQVPRIVEMRVLAFTRLSSQQQEILIEQMERIWAPQGITIRWTCEQDEVCMSLVLVDPPASADATAGSNRRLCPLGSIPFVRGRPSRTLYVAMNQVRRLVRDAAHFNTPAAVQELLAARVAGRAAAHELAHYLLATADHVSDGLLRRAFSTHALLGASLEPFMLEERQRKELSLLPR